MSDCVLNDLFPLCNLKGSDCSGINYQKMKLIAEHGPCLNNKDILTMLEAHHEFLASGGAGGQWKPLQVGDIVIGFYDKEEGVNKGEQANFERKNLTSISFNKMEFPFANFCSAFANKTDFSFSNLSFSLFTDSTLSEANFEGAYLKNIDFSRSNLSGASFRGANLSGVDFENCDLRFTDFTGAKFDTARFPGADIDHVIY